MTSTPALQSSSLLRPIIGLLVSRRNSRPGTLNPHALVYVGFILLPVAVALLVAWAGKSTVLTFSIVVWMLLVAALARSGVLSQFSSLPPPMALLLVGGLAGTIALARSRWVRHLLGLPIGLLIGFPAFPILVEV